jgi:hypothetical protein
MDKLFDFAKNFSKGPFTTAIGMAVSIVSCYSFMFQDLEPEKAIVGVMLGAALCGLPDPKNPSKKNDEIPPSAMLVFLLFFASCSPKSITNSSEHKDSTFVKVITRDVEAKTPADSSKIIIPYFMQKFQAWMKENSEAESMDETFGIDSATFLNNGYRTTIGEPSQFSGEGSKSIKKKSKYLKFNSTSAHAHTEVRVDSSGTLTAECLCNEQKITIQAKDSIIHSMKMDRIFKETVKEVHTPYWYDIMCRWFTGLGLLFIILLILLKY